jgi:hypothetical protein
VGPSGNNADRIADLELRLSQLERYTATQSRSQAPQKGIILKNAISALPPDAEEGDPYEPSNRPWIIFVNAADPEVDETTKQRREKPAHRAQTRDGSLIAEEGQKLVVYYYSGRWWIVPNNDTVQLVYVGNPDASDAYVEPEATGNYDARIYSLRDGDVSEPSETKIWLAVGQCFDEHDSVTPLPRGLVLLAKACGTREVGEGEDSVRPFYYADHWQWLWVKLYLGGPTKLLDQDDERDGEAKVLDKDGTETDLTITVFNHAGVSIPDGSRVFVFYHAESGQWWIHNPPAGSIVRAKVLDAVITTTGDVNFFDDNTNDWSADATEIVNRGRPLFADEEITVGLNRSGDWVPLEVPHHLFNGTADADIDKGDAGDVILDGGSTPTISANTLLGSVANGDMVIVAWINNDWHILAAECPEEA